MKQRHDGRWAKKITLPNGSVKFFYSTADTESKAKKDIEKQILEYNVSLNIKKRNAHNFKVVADEMLENQAKLVSYATFQSYKYSIEHMSSLFSLDIEDVTPMLVQNILNEMGRQKYSKSAMSKFKTTIGLILKHAILLGCNTTNFSTSLKVPKTTTEKILAPDDVVIETITQNASKADFGLWALTLLCTGLRPGEVNALTLSDIDFSKRTIQITHAVEFIENQPHVKPAPKTENGFRLVPILDLLYEPLYKHCSTITKDEYIFGGAKPFSKTQLRKRWKKYCKEVGHQFTQYQLRHAYALILYRAGIDPKTMQYLLGHADFSTTMNIYTQFSKEKNMEAAEYINSFMNKTLSNSLTTF